MPRHRLFRLQHRYAPYLFVAPFLAVFAVFWLYPMVKSAVLAFYQTYGPKSYVFTGLGNFRHILLDASFRKAVWNTAVFAACSVFLQLPVSLGLALLLNWRMLKARNAFRFGFFSPYLTGRVFVAVLFGVIFAPRFGLINQWLFAITDRSDPDYASLNLVTGIVVALVALPLAIHVGVNLGRRGVEALRAGRTGAAWAWMGGAAVAASAYAAVFLPWHGVLARGIDAALTLRIDRNWLQEDEMVMPALVVTALWMYAGFNMIYFLAALQSVDRDLYDAAHVDGAGPVQRFWHVTLPGIKPVAVFVVLVSMIGSFQLFELPWLMLDQTAGPEQAGLTVVMYLYQKGFGTGDLGYAAAVGWMLALGVMTVALAQLRLSGMWKRKG